MSCQKTDLVRQKTFSFLEEKKLLVSDFSDVIYTTNKNELIMWLNRNTELLDSFPPQKWEVNACST